MSNIIATNGINTRNLTFSSQLMKTLKNPVPKNNEYAEPGSLIGRVICIGAATIGVPFIAALTGLTATINLIIDTVGLLGTALLSFFQWEQPLAVTWNDLEANGKNLLTLPYLTIKAEIKAIAGIFNPKWFLNKAEQLPQNARR